MSTRVIIVRTFFAILFAACVACCSDWDSQQPLIPEDQLEAPSLSVGSYASVPTTGVTYVITGPVRGNQYELTQVSTGGGSAPASPIGFHNLSDGYYLMQLTAAGSTQYYVVRAASDGVDYYGFSCRDEAVARIAVAAGATLSDPSCHFSSYESVLKAANDVLPLIADRHILGLHLVRAAS